MKKLNSNSKNFDKLLDILLSKRKNKLKYPNINEDIKSPSAFATLIASNPLENNNS